MFEITYIFIFFDNSIQEIVTQFCERIRLVWAKYTLRAVFHKNIIKITNFLFTT